MAVLVEPNLLKAALDSDQPPVVLDIRWTLGGAPGVEAYVEGHVPGARFVDLERELASAPRPDGVGGRHPLPDIEVFQAAMRRVGVGPESPIVVYDGGTDGFAAARAWWCLRYFGHPDRLIAVLDGGYRAWQAAGSPIEDGPYEGAEAAGEFVAVPGGMPTLDASTAATLAETGVLLDARAAPRYRGEQEPVDPVAGHIPGAVSAPTGENLDDTGRFLPTDVLRTRFDQLGATENVGTYCGSGVSAAQQVFASELAGIRSALYVGSWSDWVSDPGRPVATGPTP